MESGVDAIGRRGRVPGTPSRGAAWSRLRYALFDLFPDQDGPTLASIKVAFVRGRRDRQHIAVELIVPNLIGSGPGLVPRDVDMVRHPLGLHREGSGVSHHGPEQLDALLLGR